MGPPQSVRPEERKIIKGTPFREWAERHRAQVQQVLDEATFSPVPFGKKNQYNN